MTPLTPFSAKSKGGSYRSDRVKFRKIVIQFDWIQFINKVLFKVATICSADRNGTSSTRRYWGSDPCQLEPRKEYEWKMFVPERVQVDTTVPLWSKRFCCWFCTSGWNGSWNVKSTIWLAKNTPCLAHQQIWGWPLLKVWKIPPHYLQWNVKRHRLFS